jgi:phosphoribosylaminoimidazole-succinocarboxamide synthase
MKTIFETDFEKLGKPRRGKTRDIYDLGSRLLIIATDRLSAFDVIMRQPIPMKGIILTQMTLFWLNLLEDVIENHLITADIDKFPEPTKDYQEELRDRSFIAKKAKIIPIECIVRGYISGSAIKEYKQSGSVCGIKLPEGLVEADKLPEPIFTPSTKAELGEHDENITEQKAIDLIGKETYDFIKNKSLELYLKASEYAYKKGIIIADTKFEFGFYDDKIILCDEVLTPDSSRFWNLNEYERGKEQNSFDKQYVRNYLMSINFEKKPPAPLLPDYVIETTRKKYLEIFKILTE